MRVAIVPVLLACCAAEVGTALHRPEAIDGIEWAAAGDESDATVVIIAGTITYATLPMIRAQIDALVGPRSVVAFGVCASTGGPYWDAPTVVQGWSGADLFIPGCPPPARALWASIARAARMAVPHATR